MHDTTCLTDVNRVAQGDEFSIHQIRVELSSENDLFFHFTHTLDEASFAVVQVSTLVSFLLDSI